MTQYRQRLLWTPKVKGRPRTTFDFQHQSYRTYTPAGTVEAERALAQQWVGTPIEGPIVVGLVLSDADIEVTVQAAEPCASKKLNRGDLDNYVKLVLDGLNGRAWNDDRQIVALSARKT